MSVTYNIKINIVRREKIDLSSTDILESLIDAGWSLFSEENLIIYTDIGDDDDFNFMSKSMNKNQYYTIVKQKQKNDEEIER